MPNAMHLHILGSGSKGNCSIVESPAGFIMIDNGFSRRETLARMHALGLDEIRVRALILTHEHSDHTRGVVVWCKRFSGTLIASAGTPEARSGFDALPFQAVEPGEAFDIEDVHVQTFPTSHDVVNPMGLRLSCGDDAIGFATDTGTLSDAARNALRDARILALECNHDVHMLTSGDYPRFLKERILSNTGHLSNAQAAEAACELVTNRTEELVAMHISQENNRPGLAVRALADALGATLDNDLGTAATLERPGTVPGLHIRAAGQDRPVSIW